jgi:hypothetical protein
MAYFERLSEGRAPKARRRMRLGWLVVAVAAAFTVPVAHADNWGASAELSSVGVRPDDRAAGPRTDALTSIAVARRADDRGGIRGVGSTPSSVAGPTSATAAPRPDDRVGVRGFGPTPTPTPAAAAVAVQRIDNFQWADAGIGAATALAAMMVLAAVALAIRRNRASPSPVAP